jgi:hypothetical protein
MACPNYQAEVEKCAADNPQAFKDCHTGNEHTEDFVRILAAQLHALDPRIGLNGKRGNPNDISDDAVNILDPIDGVGKTPSGRRCWVVDVVGSAGAPNAVPAWQQIMDEEGSSGAHVLPGPPPTPEPVQQPYPSESPDGGWWGQEFDKAVEACYTEAGRVYPDPDDEKSLRWCGRCAYDICAGLTKEDALEKHIAELRVALGLPAF